MNIEPRPLTIKEYMDKRRDFLICAEPYFKAKADFYAFTMPTRVIYENGKMETSYNFTPDQQKTLDLLDDVIEQIRHSIYGPAL